MTVSNNMADSSSREREGEGERKHIEQQHREKSLTPFERLTYDLAHDERYLKEITLGKRIGFYRIRGELGSGNFCQVKMGIHSLTRGKLESVQREAIEKFISFTPCACNYGTHIDIFSFQTKLLSRS